jgi:hypothetical protein
MPNPNEPDVLNSQSTSDEKSPFSSDSLWHLGLTGVLKGELFNYLDSLSFTPESQLTAEPLRMDLLILKKPNDVVIDKNLGRIFRGVNVIEYKSHSDSLGLLKFFKVLAYTFLYLFNTNQPSIDDITLTFISKAYPRDVISFLKKKFGCGIEKKYPGIHYVTKSPIPIQFIETKKLSATENRYLWSLDNEVDFKTLGSIVNEIDQMGSSGEFQAFIYALFERNKKTIEETIRMQAQVHPVTSLVGDILSAWSKRGYVPDFIKEEQKELTEAVTKQVTENITKQVAEATGLKNAKRLVDDGMTVEKAARMVQLPMKQVRAYCRKLNSI